MVCLWSSINKNEDFFVRCTISIKLTVTLSLLAVVVVVEIRDLSKGSTKEFCFLSKTWVFKIVGQLQNVNSTSVAYSENSHPATSESPYFCSVLSFSRKIGPDVHGKLQIFCAPNVEYCVCIQFQALWHVFVVSFATPAEFHRDFTTPLMELFMAEALAEFYESEALIPASAK